MTLTLLPRAGCDRRVLCAALLDFCAYLATEPAQTIGVGHDADPLVRAFVGFCEAHRLDSETGLVEAWRGHVYG